MKRAIDTLRQMSSDNRKIAVLGDMMELGNMEKEFHYEIGKYLAEIKPDYLFTCGTLSEEIASGAIEKGMSEEKIYKFRSSDEIGKKLDSILQKDDHILIKGSRVMKMENVVRYLEEKLIKE